MLSWNPRKRDTYHTFGLSGAGVRNSRRYFSNLLAPRFTKIPQAGTLKNVAVVVPRFNNTNFAPAVSFLPRIDTRTHAQAHKKRCRPPAQALNSPHSVAHNVTYTHMRTPEGAGLRLRHSIRTHAASAAGAAAAGAACREHLDLTNKNFHQRKAFFKATLSSQSFGSTKGKTKKPPTMVRQKQNKKKQSKQKAAHNGATVAKQKNK